MDVPTLLVSALAGAAGGFFVRLRGLRHEELGRRFDDLCKDIDAAANMGTDYWLRDGSDPLCLSLEAKLVGFQHGISFGISNVSDDHKHLDTVCDRQLLEFMDQLSGGGFQSRGRVIDGNRAVGVQIAARELIAEIRRQRQSALRWWPVGG